MKGDEALLLFCASCRSSNSVTPIGDVVAESEGPQASDDSSAKLILRGEEVGVIPGDRDSLYRLIRILVSTLLVGRGGLRGGVEKSDRGVARDDSERGVRQSISEMLLFSNGS